MPPPCTKITGWDDPIRWFLSTLRAVFTLADDMGHGYRFAKAAVRRTLCRSHRTSGNYGALLVLLILSGLGDKTLRGWFTAISPETMTDEKTLAKAAAVLRIVVFLYWPGHGWLNLIGKKGIWLTAHTG